MSLTVKITIGSDTLEVVGDVAISDARAVIDQWFGSLAHAEQCRVDALVKRLSASTDRLQKRVTEATPSK